MNNAFYRLVETAYRYGSPEKVWLASPVMRNVAQSVEATSDLCQYSADRQKFGCDVVRFVAPLGELIFCENQSDEGKLFDAIRSGAVVAEVLSEVLFPDQLSSVLSETAEAKDHQPAYKRISGEPLPYFGLAKNDGGKHE